MEESLYPASTRMISIVGIALIMAMKKKKEGKKVEINEDEWKQIAKEGQQTWVNQRLKEIGALQTDNLADLEKIEDARKSLKEAYHYACAFVNSYMDIPIEHIKLIVIWIIATYFHENFNTFPYLFFNAMRGSGKSRLLSIISALGAKGDGSVQNNLTEAVLFRIPRGTTTCIDEIEQIGSKDKQTLREILNSAYKKGMKIKRMKKKYTKEGEEQVVDCFEPYFPVAMANIWGMDEVLGDRSLTLFLEKSDNPYMTKKIEDFQNNEMVKELKRTFECSYVVLCSVVKEKNIGKEWNNYIDSKYRTTLNTLTTLTTLNYTKLHKIYNNDINEEEFRQDKNLRELFDKIDEIGLVGRNFELLFPLLIIAKEIGDDVFEEILMICKDIISKKRSDEVIESKDVAVYDFVASYEGNMFSYYPIKQLVREFRDFLGEEESDDRWLNEKWFGRALKRLSLSSDKKRLNKGNVVLLNIKKAQEKMKIFRSQERGEDEKETTE